MVSVLGDEPADTVEGIRLKYANQIADAEARVTEARANLAFWSSLSGNRFFDRYTGGKRERIASILIEMKSCKPSDLPRLQGEITALESDLERIKQSAESTEVTARESDLANLKARMEKEIRDLREGYPLLVQDEAEPEPADLETDDSDD
jgi:hypothetical protein